MLLQFLANGIATSALYIIVALGFGLIYISTGIFHFAHGSVYLVAGYLLYYFYIILKLNLIISILLATVGGILCGVLIELLVYKPLDKRKNSPLTFMISSFGVYLFLVNLIALLFGNETKILNPGIDKTFEFGNIILTRFQLLSVISAIVVIIFFFLFKKTRYGKLIFALSNNPKLLKILGYDIYKLRLIVFIIGSAFASIAVFLTGFDTGLDPNIGMNAIFASAISVIIGGAKRFEGAIVGGLILGITQSLVVWQFSARWQDAFSFIVLITFLLFKPQGVLGRKLRIEEA